MPLFIVQLLLDLFIISAQNVPHGPPGNARDFPEKESGFDEQSPHGEFLIDNTFLFFVNKTVTVGPIV